jgi:CspA family cold shock protein
MPSFIEARRQPASASNCFVKTTTELTFFPSCVNPSKGYGFIQPQGGGKDIFVHISAVERAGLSTLNEGQQVQYEEVANKGKTRRRTSR